MSIPFCRIVSLLLIVYSGAAQVNSSGISIAAIPKPMNWVHAPTHWSWKENQFRITAGPKTDLFIDPRHEYAVVNSPLAIFIPEDSFLLSARAQVGFQTDYDAAVLVVYAGEDSWAKLCFEYSPQKIPFVVSVVNNRISDDCNHVPVQGNSVYLRIAGLGHQVYAFHYSLDGKKWNLVRYFRLETSKEVRVGFSSQSPTGNSCQSVFSLIHYQTKKLVDIRNGE